MKMKLVAFVYLIAMHIDFLASNPSTITIGAVLSSEEHGEYFLEVVGQVTRDPNLVPPGVTLQGKYVVMNDNPLQAARDMCDHVVSQQVYTVIVSHPYNSDLAPVCISYTGGYYKIPVIGLSVRESSFSDKNIHGSFMRTLAPFSQQSLVWVPLLQYFEFNTVIIVHSSDAEGRAMLGRFQSAAEDKIEIENTIHFAPGSESYYEQLRSIPQKQSRVIILIADEESAAVIYENAGRLNISGEGYAWFVSEKALKPKNTPIGVLGVRQYYNGEKEEDEDRHIYDAVHVIALAFKELLASTENFTEAPSNCSDVATEYDGNAVLEHLKKQKLPEGRTGLLSFNGAGDRDSVFYDVINVRRSGTDLPNNNDERYNIVGNYTQIGTRGHINMNKSARIIWPAPTTTKPKDRKIETHLKVVTIDAKPFIYTEPLYDINTKDESKACQPKNGRIPCPKTKSNGEVEQYCCYGYAMELLIKLGAAVNFTFDLHLISDDSFGALDFVYLEPPKKVFQPQPPTDNCEKHNGSHTQYWNGMIGELIRKETHMIVAPLTINPERAEVIEFSKPFKYQGLTILVKKTQKNSNLASFLQPFQNTLWILVCLSVHVVALVLYLLDRFSPFGRYKLAKSDDTEEDALNLSGAVWFAWGVLLNSGIGEGTPRSFSARVLGMVWAGFAMIIVASYTANLAAFLVLDRPEASISGIDDARLRNPEEQYQFATVRNSAVSMYFKRQVELSTMYRTMEKLNYQNADSAIAAVKSETLNAFIWDSSRLEHEAANDCDLVTAGEYFGRSGYGIGLQKNSPWTEPLTMAILDFHERGIMEKLDSTWILNSNTECPDKDSSAATLGLTNMAGVFMMVAGGIVMGVFLIFVEIAYKRHRGLKEKELELAKTAADRWRGNIEKRRTLRRTLLQQQIERGTLSNGDSPAKMAGLRNRPLPTIGDLTEGAARGGGRDDICGTGCSFGAGATGHAGPAPTATIGQSSSFQRIVAASAAPTGYQPVATNVPTPRASPSPMRQPFGHYEV